jgi:hypothetical protein
MGFAAEMKPTAGLVFRASRTYPSSASSSSHFVDQSECGDQVPHVGRWVEVHWLSTTASSAISRAVAPLQSM